MILGIIIMALQAILWLLCVLEPSSRGEVEE